MDIWETENFEQLNGYIPDIVICLKFPTYYLRHSHKVVWLLHQHRAVYELWGINSPADHVPAPEEVRLKEDITRRDTVHLAGCKKIYTISRRVSERLQIYNGLKSTPLYHPPAWLGRFYHAPAWPYIFCPSRLEGLKRQDLLIKAMKLATSPVKALIAGDGGDRPRLEQLIRELDVGDSVRLLGRISEAEMVTAYAHCLATFFGPYDEDLGYVTLEAMLSAKPVITCHDSGGSLEFAVDGETGRIVPPEPAAIAAAIDELYHNQKLARQMGANGLEQYHRMNISWENVIDKLIAS
ncbi:MAG: glycosyltransferase family 4 protein [Deltaproteobacteria bacterium]|nr:glycosyltransferase family 4 protein [Deltaproteobacteria bacterium]